MSKCGWEVRECNYGKGIFATEPIKKCKKLMISNKFDAILNRANLF